MYGTHLQKYVNPAMHIGLLQAWDSLNGLRAYNALFDNKTNFGNTHLKKIVFQYKNLVTLVYIHFTDINTIPLFNHLLPGISA